MLQVLLQLLIVQLEHTEIRPKELKPLTVTTVLLENTVLVVLVLQVEIVLLDTSALRVLQLPLQLSLPIMVLVLKATTALLELDKLLSVLLEPS